MKKLTVDISKAENGYFYEVINENGDIIKMFISAKDVYKSDAHDVIDRILDILNQVEVEDPGEESTT